MDGSHSLLIRSDSSLALRCRKGAIHPIIRSARLRGGQRQWDGDAKCFGDLQVDEQLHLRDLLHRQVGGLLAP
jgi:hypothetical protein